MTCPACGAPAFSAVDQAGRHLVLDEESSMTGTHIVSVSTLAGELPRAQLAPLPSPGPLFYPHHCPTPKPTRTRRTP